MWNFQDNRQKKKCWHCTFLHTRDYVKNSWFRFRKRSRSALTIPFHSKHGRTLEWTGLLVGARGLKHSPPPRWHGTADPCTSRWERDSLFTCNLNVTWNAQKRTALTFYSGDWAGNCLVNNSPRIQPKIWSTKYILWPKSRSSFCVILLAQSMYFVCVYISVCRIVRGRHADHLIFSAVF